MSKRIVIAGGTGLIGSALTQRLSAQGAEVVLLTRDPARAERRFAGLPHVRCSPWDGTSGAQLHGILENASAVVNLAGESIGARRWTERQKRILMTSRIETTWSLVEAIHRTPSPPDVLVNASAVGYYGNRDEGEIDEDEKPGDDFLAGICEAWEAEALKATEAGTRVVLTRTGVVLDAREGALTRFLPPFRMFVGGRLGSGAQWFPWIHRDDVTEGMLFAIGNPHVSGPINLVAPEGIRMREFCRELGRTLGRPSWAPVPSFLLRLLLGEMAGPLVLSGQHVVPAKLMRLGFRFRFPDLREALNDLLNGEEERVVRR